MRTQVLSLASLSGSRIQHCCELWCRSQTQFGSCVAVAVGQASGYTSELIPSLGTSICSGQEAKKTKKKKRKRSWSSSYFCSKNGFMQDQQRIATRGLQSGRPMQVPAGKGSTSFYTGDQGVGRAPVNKVQAFHWLSPCRERGAPLSCRWSARPLLVSQRCCIEGSAS